MDKFPILNLIPSLQSSLYVAHNSHNVTLSYHLLSCHHLSYRIYHLSLKECLLAVMQVCEKSPANYNDS